MADGLGSACLRSHGWSWKPHAVPLITSKQCPAWTRLLSKNGIFLASDSLTMACCFSNITLISHQDHQVDFNDHALHALRSWLCNNVWLNWRMSGKSTAVSSVTPSSRRVLPQLSSRRRTFALCWTTQGEARRSRRPHHSPPSCQFLFFLSCQFLSHDSWSLIPWNFDLCFHLPLSLLHLRRSHLAARLVNWRSSAQTSISAQLGVWGGWMLIVWVSTSNHDATRAGFTWKLGRMLPSQSTWYRFDHAQSLVAVLTSRPVRLCSCFETRLALSFLQRLAAQWSSVRVNCVRKWQRLAAQWNWQSAWQRNETQWDWDLREGETKNKIENCVTKKRKRKTTSLICTWIMKINKATVKSWFQAWIVVGSRRSQAWLIAAWFIDLGKTVLSVAKQWLMFWLANSTYMVCQNADCQKIRTKHMMNNPCMLREVFLCHDLGPIMIR